MKRAAESGTDMLCDLSLRKAWFADARDMVKASDLWNFWYDGEYDEDSIRFAADAVIVFGDAVKEAEERENPILADECYSNAEQALVGLMAMLWQQALPVQLGGDTEIDHTEVEGDIDVHHLGLDTKTSSSWRNKHVLSTDEARIMHASAEWWKEMWQEIRDMEAQG